jgi:hypothetical protein
VRQLDLAERDLLHHPLHLPEVQLPFLKLEANRAAVLSCHCHRRTRALRRRSTEWDAKCTLVF